MSDPIELYIANTPQELTNKRENLKLSVNDVAERMRLTPKQIDSLEAGEWKKLPGDAFVRAALRSYGKILNIEVKPLLDQIGGVGQAFDVKVPASLSTKMPRQGAYGFDASGRSSWVPWAVLGVIAVVAIGLFYGGDKVLPKASSVLPGSTAPSTSASPSAAPTPDPASVLVAPTPVPSPTPAPVPSVSAVAATASPSTAAPTPAAPVSDSVPSSAAQVAAANPVSVVSANAPMGSPASSVPSLVFAAATSAWVEVKSKSGKLIFSGYIQPNVSKTVEVPEGAANVVVGAAKSVKLEWRGTGIDVASKAKSDVARFSVE